MTLFDWQDGPASLTDDEVMILVDSKYIPAYQLEKQLDNYQRGVAIRFTDRLSHCFLLNRVFLYQIDAEAGNKYYTQRNTLRLCGTFFK